MKRFSFCFALFAAFLLILLPSCAEHLAPVGSDRNPEKVGVIILHDDPKPEGKPTEPTVDDPDTSGKQNDPDPSVDPTPSENPDDPSENPDP